MSLNVCNLQHRHGIKDWKARLRGKMDMAYKLNFLELENYNSLDYKFITNF